MLASRMVFLAIGIGLGLALGLQFRAEPESGPARPPRVVPEVVAVRGTAPPPVAPRRKFETVAVPAQPLPDPAAPDAPLAEDEDLEPGIGRLVVDFSKTGWPEPRIHVEGRLLEGGRIRFKVEADDNRLATVELLSGTHTISWMEGGQATGKRVLNVEIQEGWVTRIDVADPDLPRFDPIRDGLGRLEVFVADLGGGPLPDADVSVRGREFHGGEETVTRTPNDAGRVRFDLLPGRYEVTVGLRSEPAVVRTGECTTLDLHYRQEGEIMIEGPLPGVVGITALGPGRQARLRSRSRGSGVRRHRFVYLPPGDYLVTYQNRNRVAGRVTVRSRQVARFSHDPPPGGLQLDIVFPESKQRQHITVCVNDVASGFRVGQMSSYLRDGLSYPLPNLTPGRYRVRITGRTFESYEEEITVGSTVVVRRVELVPK